MGLRSYLFVVLVVSVSKSERNCICTTPNGEEAVCVPIEDCHLISLAVATGNIKAIEFSKMSECNSGRKNMVCCGTTGYPRNFDLVIHPKDVLVLKKPPSPCITPNGEEATCIPTGSCHLIVDAVATGNGKAVEFAKQSKCKSDGDMVCCGTTGYPRNFDVVINPKKVLLFNRFIKFEETNGCHNETNSDNKVCKDKNIKVSKIDAKVEEELTKKVNTGVINGEVTKEVKINNVNSSCLTPNGEQGTCVPTKSCNLIAQAVATRTTKALGFANKSICNSGEDNMVCCGTTGYPRDFDIVINPQKVLLASQYLGLKVLDVSTNFEIAPPKINEEDYFGVECITPNKELATCIPMESCHLMMLAIATGDPSAIEFAKKSECASKTQKLICCGTTGYSRNFDIILNPKVLISKKYQQSVQETRPDELKLGSTCFTPNGEMAKCVPIGSCGLISLAISAGNETALAFAKESRCNPKEKELFCCGTTGYPRPFNLNLKYNLFDFRFGGDIGAPKEPKCITPNGEEAKCLPLFSCRPIAMAIATGNKTAVDFSKKSECHLNSKLVCCGSTGYPNSSSSNTTTKNSSSSSNSTTEKS